MRAMRIWVLSVLWLSVVAGGGAEASPGDCPELEAAAAAVVALRDSDPGLGLQRGESVLAEARLREPRCPVGEAMLLSAIGSNLHILGRNAEAVDHQQRALALLPPEAATVQRVTLHRAAGVALADVEEFDAALEHYLQALAVSQAEGDRLEAAKTAGNIGNLYNMLGQLDRARSYHQQALADFEAAGFTLGVAGTLVNLGALSAKFALAAQEAGDADGARRENEQLRDLNQRALTLFADLGNDRGVAYAASNIGLALERLGEPMQALVEHERALSLRVRIGDVHGEINSRVTMADALIALERFEEAQEHLDLAQARISDGSFGLLVAVIERRVRLAETLGDFPQALHRQREVTRLNSELASERYNARASELQARFDTDKQAREIALLQSNAEIRELEIGQQRLLLRVGVLVGVLLLALFALLYSRLRLGRRATRVLERAVRTDPVTGLGNRRDMVERIQQEMQRHGVSGRPFVVAMVDIDRFKTINDQHGHGVGDAVLAEVATRLRTRLRGQDSLARWGGEEFLLLLPDTGLAGGRVVAEKMREAVSGKPAVIAGVSVPLSLTLGLVEYAAGMSLDDCVNAADKAMYLGKRQGRDRVVVQTGGASVLG